jgi:predicted esterase
MQMASLRHHLPSVELSFIDGTFPAYGPTDPMVAQIYTGMDYFEWTLEGKDTESLLRVIKYFEDNGPFAGILGFSQGAAMATRVALELRRRGSKTCPKFLILIGGVTPKDREGEITNNEVG